MTDPSSLLSPLLIFLATGMLKGFLGLGLGLPTLAMGLVGLLLDPAASAALLLLPSLVTDVWQTGPRGPVGPVLRRLAPFLGGIVVGAALGAPLMEGDPRLVRGVLGLTMMVYAVRGLRPSRSSRSSRPSRSSRRSRRSRVPWGWRTWGGVITGVLTGATGVFILSAVPSLAPLVGEWERLVQSSGMSRVSPLALAGVLAGGDRLPGAGAGRGGGRARAGAGPGGHDDGGPAAALGVEGHLPPVVFWRAAGARRRDASQCRRCLKGGCWWRPSALPRPLPSYLLVRPRVREATV
ncbi:TSUP family transporter [Pararhodospirillum photometricum]|uniref:TSUP family transporter n=1 Tax=Pararhodospirillum photometricum TaxID=1084 RepID=UPI000314A4D5|nr:TSUP family transporter [Pararhodospirillum photometricum]